MLHGGPGVPDYLGPVAALLAPRHCVIIFDQRGVGASVVRTDGYTIAAYLSDLEAIRTSCGVEKLHLFGHSWGGLLGQLSAATFPTASTASSSLTLQRGWDRIGSGWREWSCVTIGARQDFWDFWRWEDGRYSPCCQEPWGIVGFEERSRGCGAITSPTRRWHRLPTPAGWQA